MWLWVCNKRSICVFFDPRGAQKMIVEETLCWKCNKAFTKECSWSKEFIPVDGWEINNKNEFVINCPEFEEYQRLEKLSNVGYDVISAQIIKRAMLDYLNGGKIEEQSIEKWIRSSNFEILSDLNPETLIKLMRKQKEEK